MCSACDSLFPWTNEDEEIPIELQLPHPNDDFTDWDFGFDF